MYVQRPPRLLHLQLSVHSVQLGLFRNVFQSQTNPHGLKIYEKFHVDACPWFTRAVDERLSPSQANSLDHYGIVSWASERESSRPFGFYPKGCGVTRLLSTMTCEVWNIARSCALVPVLRI